MSSQPPTTGEKLANSLSALGVRFVLDGDSHALNAFTDPVHLIAALAGSQEARLRLALIPLFLQHPEFSAHASQAVRILPQPATITLQCYYTAAHFLQQAYRSRLDAVLGKMLDLPDLFSATLTLKEVGLAEDNLRQLAQRQAELSGMQINWYGTYQHAVQVWLRPLERKIRS